MMAMRWRGAGGVVLGVAAIMMAALPASAAATRWQIVYHLPMQNGSTDSVAAIAATGTGDAWAAGGKLAVVGGQAEGVPAVFHWNGTSWAQMPLPGPAREGSFTAVSGSSPANVWAIGGCVGCPGFVASWNGEKWTWHTNGPAGGGNSVAAFSPSDVWVADFTELDQWTGRTWRRYAAPGPNGVGALSGTAADDIWAAGLAKNGTQPQVLRWDGASWQPVSLPHIPLPKDGQGLPPEVAADSAADAWLGGTVQYPDPVTGLTDYEPFVMQWNGTSWQLLTIPGSFPADFGLAELASDGNGGFWAVADTPSASGTTLSEKLVHYHNGTWTITPLPPIPGSEGPPNAPVIANLALVPGTQQIWAPDNYLTSTGEFRELILRYTP